MRVIDAPGAGYDAFCEALRFVTTHLWPCHRKGRRGRDKAARMPRERRKGYTYCAPRREIRHLLKPF
jgi:hypothetical protein